MDPLPDSVVNLLKFRSNRHAFTLVVAGVPPTVEPGASPRSDGISEGTAPNHEQGRSADFRPQDHVPAEEGLEQNEGRQQAQPFRPSLRPILSEPAALEKSGSGVLVPISTAQ